MMTVTMKQQQWEEDVSDKPGQREGGATLTSLVSEATHTDMASCSFIYHVVPMEITFMDIGGNIFVLCEFVDYTNSYII